ncbi:MAG TPA: FAD-dependent oxidoreductase [Stellaceae bacterium]|jgi:2-polyprenyl-6-methoxyphenol hydroxylase-like FAD-dependent oxidoreductase|nr:FAD-dependent oxidoreductase [Stellaceae bacterium]
MEQARVNKVLIVGAGLGGLSLALASRRGGIDVELVEIDPALRALGAGITLNGASLRAFAALGLLSEIERLGHCHDGRDTFDGKGKLLFASRGGRSLGPDIPNGAGILRPVLHRIVYDAAVASGASIRFGLSVTSLSVDGDGVEVRFTDGTRGRYDLVVGADGISSAIRRFIFPDAPKPLYTGQGCWRAVLSKPAEIENPCSFMGYDHKAGLNPISRDEMYLFVLQYVPDNRWMPREQWPALLATELAEFDGMLAEIRENLGPGSRVNYRPLEKLLLDPPWHKGRVVLIGDAAHATTPHVGYGAGLAVEDGIVLAELLREAAPLDDILHRFAQRRYERCRLVVEGSVRLGELEIEHASAETHRATFNQIVAAIQQPI